MNKTVPALKRGHCLARETDIKEINMQINTWPQKSINALKEIRRSHEHEGNKYESGGQSSQGRPP